jgi:hypothetical protein
MAEPKASQDNAKDAGFFAAAGKLLESVRTPVNNTISIVSGPLMRDGWVARARSQGADELWQALRAFPDRIEAPTIGAHLNPAGAEFEPHGAKEPATLGEVLAMDTSNVPEREKGQDQGLSM